MAVNSVEIPFQFEEDSGTRPVVPASLNGVERLLHVHSNAGFYVQMGHDDAASAGVAQLKYAGEYGIVDAGQLSSRGRAEGVLPRLAIGDTTWPDVPASVFETYGGVPRGMLGVKWIESNRLVMDFSNKTLRLEPQHSESTESPEGGFSPPSGYEAIPMHRNLDTGRYTVDATVQGVTRSMIVSTVAHLILDTEFAQAAEIKHGPAAGQSGGPTGAVLSHYFANDPVRITLGKWSSLPMVAKVHDIYGYMGQERPTNGAGGGMLGADFLIAARAIVDFGQRYLYLPSSSSGEKEV